MEELRTLARHTGPHGELALRLRTGPDGEVHELVVDGAFAMDSRETASERRLAGLVAEHGALGRVLVGGLGLGYTATALLEAGAGRVEVVELEAALVRWAHEGVTPQLGALATHPRCRLHVDDVARWIATAEPGSLDAVVLDVDNGPDFLIHPGNAELYQTPRLAAALRLLRPGGVLVVWCQHRTPQLRERLSELGPTAEEVVPVEREGHRLEYALYTVRADPSGTAIVQP
ncbi:hypothetical protein DT076_04130 [Desertihabitans brevis]|uniref:Spermidine synthase n=1 Tax=Desertihabitans brevis TaxID=2268447 RepID=A0A367YY13_9ACTN|nr:hypothetical protein [Desertihabitans brevis]RCK70617.1 hypothetical protein DT076_04130 [Desertihabitans brevis]